MTGLVVLALFFAAMFFVFAHANQMDYLAPAVALPASFLICCLASVYNSAKYGVGLSVEPLLLIIVATLVFCLAASACTIILGRKLGGVSSGEHTRDTQEPFVPRAITVPNGLLVVSVVFCALVVALYYRDLTSTFGSLGLTGDWNENMNSYRFASSFKELEEGEGISGFVNFLYKAETAVAFFFMYVGVQNFMSGAPRVKSISCFFPLVMHCLCVIMTGGRMGIVRMVLGASVLAWVLWNAKTAWMRRIRISMLLKALLLLVVMGIAFWLAGTAVGRQIDSGPFDYIASYIGYAIILFGKFVEEGAANTSQFFGSETFVGMYNFIGNHFGVDEFVYTYHLEWRYLGSVSMGNVYTAYRYWLHDFGIGGMMLVACLYGVFFSVFYEKAKRYVPRIGAAGISSPFNLPLMMYSYFAYGMFLIPICDCVLATEFVVTTPFIVTAMWLMCRYLTSRQGRSGES